MRVGSLVFATDQGLGYLAKDFYDHGILTDVAIVRHGKRTTHLDWYPENSTQISSRPFLNEEVKALVREMDAMFFLETPFEWGIIDFCREHRITTALMPMYECMPQNWPADPDRIICPSKLDYDLFGGVHIPVPVNVDWKLRVRAETFVHNAGHLGLKGRNGTRELLDALRYVESPINLIVRSQEYIPVPDDDRIEYHRGTIRRENLYNEGDVFIFPEKFNGLSLPLQEARAAGMLVMGSRRHPMTDWLPSEPLIPVSSYSKIRVASRFRLVESAVLNLQTIAQHIDSWYGRDISGYSEQGKHWARDNSWEVLRPKYLEALQ